MGVRAEGVPPDALDVLPVAQRNVGHPPVIGRDARHFLENQNQTNENNFKAKNSGSQRIDD